MLKHPRACLCGSSIETVNGNPLEQNTVLTHNQVQFPGDTCIVDLVLLSIESIIQVFDKTQTEKMKAMLISVGFSEDLLFKFRSPSRFRVWIPTNSMICALP